MMRRLTGWLVRAALVIVVAVASIIAALLITPMQRVSTAGQTIRVGVTLPSWRWSGPGQVDLFGQHLPTVIDFAGPIRPRLELTHITLSEQLAQFAASGAHAAGDALQRALVQGWTSFFVWQLVIAAVVAIVLFGAVAGWLRKGWGRTLGIIVIGLVTTVALDAGVVMVTAYTAPDRLSAVRSLQDLVGATPVPDLPTTARPDDTPIEQVVVIGDSTAAGIGNPLVVDPTPEDTACHRSRDAYAVDLAAANAWHVTNLACSGATIRSGLLGPQVTGSMTVDPQMADPAVTEADLIIVSIGANDVNWETMLKLCAITSDCADSAQRAYLQQQLNAFTTDFLQLIAALQALPNHPGVIINQYYDPVGGPIDCLAEHGLTKDKQQSLQTDLDALNAILAQGAEAAGFTTAAPDFSGHGVCTDDPYVQGVDDGAPFHPTASGQLAIAFTDQRALAAPAPAEK